MIPKAGDFYSHGCIANDGSVILASQSEVTRVTDANLTSEEFNTGGPITDFCMADADNRRVFVSSANRPIKLLDTVNLDVCSHYIAYSHVEDIEHPFRLCMSKDNSQLIGGFDSVIKIWDVERPGRQVQDMKLSTRKGKEGLSGYVGALAPKDKSVIAAGTYSKTIALIDTRCSTDGLFLPILEFGSTGGGVNQLVCLSDGFTLVSGHRQDKKIRFWDTRNQSGPVSEFARDTPTSQCLKITKYKDNSVLAGDSKGFIHLFDKTGILASQAAFDSAVTFISLDPHKASNALIACGGRSERSCAKFFEIPST